MSGGPELPDAKVKRLNKMIVAKLEELGMTEPQIKEKMNQAWDMLTSGVKYNHVTVEYMEKLHDQMEKFCDVWQFEKEFTMAHIASLERSIDDIDYEKRELRLAHTDHMKKHEEYMKKHEDYMKKHEDYLQRDKVDLQKRDKKRVDLLAMMSLSRTNEAHFEELMQKAMKITERLERDLEMAMDTDLYGANYESEY